MTGTPTKRCAIYTRKSTHEGLEQAFNSLHAQRAACEAYVLSQVGEGWKCLAQTSDDGGHSGATMDRPGLGRLLGDIEAGLVDIVVVYKVDRLTRSLGDFARIIERLDKGSVSFVSVTQSFNTTSSMGKLTLNVLLSFAQFERDVTSERIRDKIQASKARGLWMGGTCPMGYRPSSTGDRTLVVETTEADTVRMIFRRLLELGSVGAAQKALNLEGVRTHAGFRWSRGALQHLLTNPTYTGLIRHREKLHPGRHEAIIDQATFDAVQAIVTGNQEKFRTRVTRADGLLMRGLVFDADGQEMEPVFAMRRGNPSRYSYYVSKPFPGSVDADGNEDTIRRVPTKVADGMARSLIGRLLERPTADLTRIEVRRLVRRMDIMPAAVHFTMRCHELPGATTSADAMAYLRSRVRPRERIFADPSNAGVIQLVLPTRLITRGGRTTLTGPDGRAMAPPRAPDPTSVNMLRHSHQVLRTTGADPTSIKPIRNVQMPTAPAARRSLDLAFLAPDLQKFVLRGSVYLPASLPDDLPLSWKKQRRLIAMLDPASAKVTSEK